MASTITSENSRADAELSGSLRKMNTACRLFFAVKPTPAFRAAAGGDEASVFAKDLLGMYEKYCQAKGWRFAAHDVRRTEFGGVASAMAEVMGEGCYASLRFESGVHRVQRVPATETQGRVHTSTVTVAVVSTCAAGSSLSEIL